MIRLDDTGLERAKMEWGPSLIRLVVANLRQSSRPHSPLYILIHLLTRNRIGNDSPSVYENQVWLTYHGVPRD